MYRVLSIFAAVSMALGTSAALAEEITKLPDSAKQLTKEEIISAYANKHLTWSHPTTDKGHGTTIVDATVTTMSGTYDVGGSKGEWEGKISWNGQQYCYQTRPKGSQKKYSKKTCNLIYSGGNNFIEVDPKTKKVLSVNTIIQ